MSQRYKYVSAVLHRHRKAGEVQCVICGEKGHWVFFDNKEKQRVYACRAHREDMEKMTYVRNELIVQYRLRSGWDENPIWHCPVVLDKPQQVDHLHTTQDAGQAPSIFSGKTSGLLFKARGSLWPIEARNGQLELVIWKNDNKQVKNISPQEAISILRKQTH